MKNLLNYLDESALHREALWTMWDCVERGEFDEAMRYHFVVLFHNDNTKEYWENADEFEIAFFEEIMDVTYDNWDDEIK